MNDALALRGEVTETSYEPEAGISYEEWSGIGAALGQMGRSSAWWLGDWLRHGEAQFGETYTQAIDLTGYDYGTLANYAYVAERVPPERRRETLGWSLHQAVASKEPQEQKRLLDLAERDCLSRSELRRLMAAGTHGNGVKRPPERPSDAERIACHLYETQRALRKEQGIRFAPDVGWDQWHNQDRRLLVAAVERLLERGVLKG